MMRRMKSSPTISSTATTLHTIQPCQLCSSGAMAVGSMANSAAPTPSGSSTITQPCIRP